MGTVGYMAPEQVRGGEVDHRADLFALGVTLYEMLSGRRAFAGDSTLETLHAILNSEPAEFETLGVPVPADVARIVTHCLEKNAADRFQSARDLAFHLAGAGGSSGEVRRTAAPDGRFVRGTASGWRGRA
jgi:serine/threonine protein kinase